MPGGPKQSWEKLKDIFDKISAKAPEPCTDYIGPDGAGHFVKMVHNGIEYADMQLISEAYHILKCLINPTNQELSEIFGKWNQGVLSSYLIEITSKIFAKEDDNGDGSLIDKILDKAGQKGTGKWTVQEALDLGVPVPGITAAVDARILSSLKSERVEANKIIDLNRSYEYEGDREHLINSIHDALYFSKIVSYAQGMDLISKASVEFNWNLKLDSIANLWKGGCIIRAVFLEEIRKAYLNNPKLQNLVLDDFMLSEIKRCLPEVRSVIGLSINNEIPLPAFSSSLAYFDAYKSCRLPQNLVQAQRDFFGAHTYKRTDKEGTFHTDWQ
ncbi:UNVERIFIED_CONTAM: hypothetical protein GTU68_043973 [Idotea baltica]|nr:hypothetical protein [Idotea baltica]